MQRRTDTKPKQYVVVLAHADGWGALAANQLIQHLHEHYPRLGIHLVVSTATKTKSGQIATKLEALKPMRELKETNLLTYFEKVDELYERMRKSRKIERTLDTGTAPEDLSEAERFDYYFKHDSQSTGEPSANLLTFKQLGRRYCYDEDVHYTNSGGPKGGLEAAEKIAKIQEDWHEGKGPEVLLSVDTMAILPKELLEQYNCFSTHPGPIDTIKIEGMQGTERALVNQILYDEKGRPLPAEDKAEVTMAIAQGKAHLKGTMFLQHPELDKGPPISTVLTPIYHGMCAYEARDKLYHALVNRMIKFLPKLLDKSRRATLVAEQTRRKGKLDEKPHTVIPDLDAEQFARWQGEAIGISTGEEAAGITVVQNSIVDPLYFRNLMARFYPGNNQEDGTWVSKEARAGFTQAFKEAFAPTLQKVARQKRLHLESDPWATLAPGNSSVIITRRAPKAGDPVASYSNRNGNGPGRD